MWHGATDAVYAMRGEMDAAAGWPLRLDDTSGVARIGTELYRTRIAPLEPDLAGVRRLIVASPSAVRGVPLEALPCPGGGWLGDRYVVRYVPTAVWDVARGRVPPRDARAWRALLVGDADGGTAWPRLAGARGEIDALAAALPAATRLGGARASEAGLRALAASGALGRCDLLHVATHVAVDDRFPGRTAFVLAEAGDATAPPVTGSAAPDGFVTVDEIASTWSLRARLVSLAGCRSALGWVSHAEGFLGLEQAVLGAGARSVLLGLWRVDDRATALLVQRFYARLLRPGAAPPDAAMALAAARRDVREWRAPDGSRPWRHPVYWAGVVLIGDPER
jgi:CHAT domain-containing protein